jgi:hypothetical protein
MKYGKGGAVSATGGAAAGSWWEPAKRTPKGIPYLRIMIAIVILVLLGLGWLLLTGNGNMAM